MPTVNKLLIVINVSTIGVKNFCKFKSIWEEFAMMINVKINEIFFLSLCHKPFIDSHIFSDTFHNSTINNFECKDKRINCFIN